MPRINRPPFYHLILRNVENNKPYKKHSYSHRMAFLLPKFQLMKTTEQKYIELTTELQCICKSHLSDVNVELIDFIRSILSTIDDIDNQESV